MFFEADRAVPSVRRVAGRGAFCLFVLWALAGGLRS